jgi:hypothetical protein
MPSEAQARGGHVDVVSSKPGANVLTAPTMALALRSVLRVGAACVCAIAAAQAQPNAPPALFECAPLVASTSNQPAYGPAPSPQRCEGYFQKNVSQAFLEVVSLTRSPPGVVAADGAGQLNLRHSSKLPLRLLIQPLRSNPLYRVDLPVAQGATVVWGSAPMLQATGLKLRDLGFLAQAVSLSQPLTLAPVLTQPLDEGSTAYAVLRPSVAVTALAWRAYRLKSQSEPSRDSPTGSPSGSPKDAVLSSSNPLSGVWQNLPGPPLFAWERIALPIALPTDGLGLRIDVRALDSQGQPLPLLQFAVLGVQDEKP